MTVKENLMRKGSIGTLCSRIIVFESESDMTMDWTCVEDLEEGERHHII